jgi:hypothetical protein
MRSEGFRRLRAVIRFGEERKGRSRELWLCFTDQAIFTAKLMNKGIIFTISLSGVWWYTPIILVLWRQENCKFEASLGYRVMLSQKKIV